jgi:hypothetical protein
MISELHRNLVRQAEGQGWRTGPWKDAFAKRIRQRPWREDREEILDEIRTFRALPDAWRFRVVREDPFCDALLYVEFLEVEISYQVPADKMLLYSDLWETFDCSGLLEFCAFRMDRYGVVRPMMDLDAYYEGRRVRAEENLGAQKFDPMGGDEGR